MQVNVTVDDAQLVLMLQNGQRRLAFGVVDALNATALRIRSAEEREVRDSFQVRRNEFWFGRAHAAAHILQASVPKGRRYTEVSLSAPPGRGLIGNRFLAPMLTEGGVRKPFTPSAARVAVPLTGSAARPSWASPVPKELEFRSIGLVKYRRNKRGKAVRYRRPSGRQQSLYGTEGRVEMPAYEPGTWWRGKQGTYMVLREDGSGWVFQRQGGRSRAIYKFLDPMPVEKLLDWLYTAEITARRWFPEEMERQVIEAIGHARGRGL